MVAACLVFLFTTWLTVSTVSYIGSRNLLTDRADYIRKLEAAYNEAVSNNEVSTEALLAQVDTLEARAAEQQVALAELDQIKAGLRRAMASKERQIDALTGQRNEAVASARGLRDAKVDLQERLATLRADRSFLGGQLETAQQRLAAASFQRDAGRRVEQRLRWEVAKLEEEVGTLQDRESTRAWFKDWIDGSVGRLHELFTTTGIDVDRLIARASIDETAQGGPLQGLALPEGVAPEAPQFDDPIAHQIGQLTALQKLASTMPLASPLDHYHITSSFGRRKDPFTQRWAFHSGLDFGAAPNSKILATGPGIVTHAGPKGPYGIMVEIDHGMGVSTRYGHLKDAIIAVGTVVDYRTPIGVIGSTGRSTGRHLHYEIWFDGRPYDPARFLEAGRYLVDVFDFRREGAALATSSG